jgi:hypothetical protein
MAGCYRQYDDQWFSLLDKNRKFIAHEGGCYLAIDISDDDNRDLLVMKDALIEFNDPNAFFTLADISSISQGFATAKLDGAKLLV